MIGARAGPAGLGRLLFGAVLLAAVGAPSHGLAQSMPSGGDGTIYIGTYDHRILILDESTMEVMGEIPTESQISAGLQLSHDESRFYMQDAELDAFEVVDIASRTSLGRYSLSTARTAVRINGLTPDPDDGYVVMFVREYRKLRDRYEIGDPLMLKYDLASRTVADTLDLPGGEEDRENAGLIFAPDGGHVYFMASDLIVLETEGFTEVDRWEISEPWEPGLGPLNLGFGGNPYDEPGIYTGLFRTTDPVNNRRLMGVARIDLEARDVDFYTLGPSESIQFRMAPGGEKAYGLHSEIGRYEFLTFDLVGRRLESRQQFAGRPRMSLMPSSNGTQLYIHTAGNTIDVYDAATYEHLHQVELDADMTSFVLVPSDGS